MSLLAEWVDKAEADYQSAVALGRRRKAPLPDIVCYHCQQCVEKYLKAYLIAQGSTPPRIHDLEELLNLCALHDATLTKRLPLVQFLNPYAVLIRYPGMTATVVERKKQCTPCAGCALFCDANWAYLNLAAAGLLETSLETAMCRTALLQTVP